MPSEQDKRYLTALHIVYVQKFYLLLKQILFETESPPK